MHRDTNRERDIIIIMSREKNPNKQTNKHTYTDADVALTPRYWVTRWHSDSLPPSLPVQPSSQSASACVGERYVPMTWVWCGSCDCCCSHTGWPLYSWTQPACLLSSRGGHALYLPSLFPFAVPSHHPSKVKIETHVLPDSLSVRNVFGHVFYLPLFVCWFVCMFLFFFFLA